MAEGVGRAGDAVIVDTLGLHRGTIPSCGMRMVAVAYMTIATRRNRVLDLLAGGVEL